MNNLIGFSYMSDFICSLIVCIICLYQYIKYSENYMLYFSIAWSIFGIKRILDFHNILYIGDPNFIYYTSIFTYIAVGLVISGFHKCFNKTNNSNRLLFLIICIIYSLYIVTVEYNMSSILKDISISLIGICLLWGGIDILKIKTKYKKEKKFAGIILSMIATIIIIYPFMKKNVLLIYFIIFNSVLIIILSFNILVMYYEKIINKLIRSEERFRLISELSPNAILITNEEKTVYFNNAALKLFRVKNKQELYDRSIYNFVHPFYLDYVKEMIKKMYKYKKPQKDIEIKIVTSEGSNIDVESTIIPFPYNEQESMLCISRDITQRKENDRLIEDIKEKTEILKYIKELEKLREEFFANISHDLRTPINVILSILQIREKGNINFKYDETIKQNCYRLLKLVNNIIDMTKIDAGFYKIRLINSNIVSVVENITLSVVDYAQSKGITLIFDTDIEEKIIACDPEKMERVILNLLSNAIKFTDKGGKILVQIQNDVKNITIIVKDSGIGIPEENLQTIFERFNQVEGNTSKNPHGSGIGLSLVKSLVELHDGNISVKSKIGEGTEFIIELPAKPIYDISSDNIDSSVYNDQTKEKISIEFADI